MISDILRKPASKFLKIGEAFSFHYMESGDGLTPLVFVPGWTMAADVFEWQFSHFMHSKDFRFISVDPRSHGKTSQTNLGNHYEQHGRDLHDFLTALGLKDVVLAGWSNGAYGVHSYIDQFSAANVRAVIVIDSPPKASGYDKSTEWVEFRWDDADGLRRASMMGCLLDRDRFNREFAADMVDRVTPEYLDWISRMSSQTPDETAALLNEAGVYMDFEATLRRLNGTVPLCFFLREDWQGVAKAWIAENTPASKVFVLGKHLMFWEYASQFNAHLDDFLGSLS